MKLMFCAAALLATVSLSEAQMVVGPWTPLFKGIDHAVGNNYPNLTNIIQQLQVVHCLKIDLTDPDVRLFTTPAANNWVNDVQETLSLSISNYIKLYGVAVATDANFGNLPGAEGQPTDVYGLLICTGRVVSAFDTYRYASLMFTTNKTPSFHYDMTPPNTTGIDIAVTGFYPLLTNGVNVWDLYYNDMYNAYLDTSIHGVQPRTAFGISADKRYLFMMTIDGRQQGYSDGAYDADTARWMLQFGARDALNMDGGGSTALYMAGDCPGSSLPLGHSSSVAATGQERIISCHFGVYSKPNPVFINNAVGIGGDTNAIVTWTTVGPASSLVEYGTNLSYGTFSANDPTPVTNHSVTLTGLVPAKQYYFRLFSSVGVTQYSWACGGTFRTTNDLINGMIFDVTNNWRYSTANLDAVPSWRATTYNDSAWSQGQGVFWVETSPSYVPNPNPEIQVLPLNTNQMPFDPSTTYPFITYYFRTHFTYTGVVAGATLTLSNYVDDGATFYLNGVEINRLFLPTNAINSTLATGSYCPPDNNATCPYLFSVASNLVSSLLKVGDNVLAVEVHNKAAISTDVTFGSALYFTSLVPPPPFLTNVTATPGETSAIITWTTISNSSSLVRYGLTTGLTSHTTNDPTLVTNHSMTLTGLLPLTNYYFRVYSVFSNVFFQGDGAFTTVPFYDGLTSLSNVWVYNTNNLDGVKWQPRNFDDSTWLGAGPALLYIETNALVSPRNTPLPGTAAGLPAPTYYFRTHFSMTTNVLFVFNTNLAGFSLLFTNYIDDGAVFYLNGTEVQRVRMAPAPATIRYTNLATACAPVNCAAVASAPDLFRITGNLLTNLVVGGDNVLAAEVHQYSKTSPNIVFGSALGLVRALASETKLHCVRSGNMVSNYWDGLGLTLQQVQTLGGTNTWSDVPGPVTSSPYVVTNPPASTFYRLRN